MVKSDDACQIECVHHEVVDKVKESMPSDELIERIAAVFKAMGDPTRARIIAVLSESELCVCDISTLLNMTQSAISHQLRVLRSLKLVKYRRKGKQVFYSLDDHHIIGLYCQCLEHVQEDG